MAPVAGRPFLYYVINYLRSQGIERFIFSLGYKADYIKEFLETEFSTLNYRVAQEKEPLGTGGAILHSLAEAETENILVANGDTLFRIDLEAMESIHTKNSAECTIALKKMKDIDRYGMVQTDNDNRVVGFQEKKFYKEGFINGGNYLLNKSSFLNNDLPEKFSFEKDYLEKKISNGKIFGVVQEGYFIDIGIPGDYRRAQTEFTQSTLNLSQVDKTWTLFIDRDGVLNPEKTDGYILNWEEFRFYPGVLNAMKKISGRFGKIIIVSNQRGVGRKLMSEDDLKLIHKNLESQIVENGGRVDKILYCTATDNLHPNRKPNPGMAFSAKKTFPEIEFSKALMVGNKLSDMRFGKAAGMFTIYLKTTNPEQPFPHPDIDLIFNNLEEFAKVL